MIGFVLALLMAGLFPDEFGSAGAFWRDLDVKHKDQVHFYNFGNLEKTIEQFREEFD